MVQGLNYEPFAFFLRQDRFQSELYVLALIDIVEEHINHLIILEDTLKHIVEPLNDVYVAFLKCLIKIKKLSTLLEHLVVFVLLLNIIKVPHNPKILLLLGVPELNLFSIYGFAVGSQVQFCGFSLFLVFDVLFLEKEHVWNEVGKTEQL